GLEHGLRLEGRTAEPVTNDPQELGVEGLGLQALQLFLLWVADSHNFLLPDVPSTGNSTRSDICQEGRGGTTHLGGEEEVSPRWGWGGLWGLSLGLAPQAKF